jgi:Carbohydrate esterase, sialic acid-specific acetylesterase/IPT/TIG domain
MREGRLRVFAALLVALAVVMTSSATAAAPSIQVFLLAGQSNMVGRGLPVSDGTGPVDPNLLLYRNGVWQVAQDPLGPDADKERGVGPGMTFGLGVLSHVAPGTTVGLIMCARGSTSIGGWRRGGGPFNNCRSMARAAGGTVAGVVFLQGEFESKFQAKATRWGKGFEAVERDFEKAFGPVPFVLGQIGNINRPYAQVVRDQQAAAAAEFAAVGLVPSVDLSLQPDGIHFTVDAAKTLGDRYADAWWSLFQAFPHVDDLSPEAGSPGTEVTLTGSSLNNVSGVTFGGAAATFTVDGPGQITAIVPDGAVTGTVVVASPYGTVTGPSFAVQPDIDSFSPASGRIGSQVLVDGKGLAGASTATVGGQHAPVKVLSSTQVRVTIPKKATSGPITIATAGGTAVSANVFTVVP